MQPGSLAAAPPVRTSCRAGERRKKWRFPSRRPRSRAQCVSGHNVECGRAGKRRRARDTAREVRADVTHCRATWRRLRHDGQRADGTNGRAKAQGGGAATPLSQRVAAQLHSPRRPMAPRSADVQQHRAANTEQRAGKSAPSRVGQDEPPLDDTCLCEVTAPVRPQQAIASLGQRHGVGEGRQRRSTHRRVPRRLRNSKRRLRLRASRASAAAAAPAQARRVSRRPSPSPRSLPRRSRLPPRLVPTRSTRSSGRRRGA